MLYYKFKLIVSKFTKILFLLQKCLVKENTYNVKFTTLHASRDAYISGSATPGAEVDRGDGWGFNWCKGLGNIEHTFLSNASFIYLFNYIALIK